GRHVSRLLYGQKWIAMDPLIWPGALAGVAATIFVTCAGILLAAGRLRGSFLLELIMTVLSIGALCVAVSTHGVIWYGWALTAAGFYPDSVGGTETYVHALARLLGEAGHQVIVVAPAAGDSEPRSYVNAGTSVFRYPIPAVPTRAEAQGRTRVRGAEAFHAWLACTRPDVVHVHSFVTGLGIAEVVAARRA